MTKIDCIVMELLRPGDEDLPRNLGPRAVRELAGGVKFNALPRAGEFFSYGNRYFRVAAVVHSTSGAPAIDVYAMRVKKEDGEDVQGEVEFVKWLFEQRRLVECE